jgi:hypothetical protein
MTDLRQAALEQPEQGLVAVKHCVTFLMHGENMAFKIGNQQFTLDFQPSEPGEFEFMENCLINALRHFTPSVQSTPPEWDKPSVSFNEWWDSDHADPANPFTEGSAAYWAWAGWKAAQRPWVGLTDDEMTEIVTDIDVDWGDLLWKVVCLTKIIKAELKERNT